MRRQLAERYWAPKTTGAPQTPARESERFQGDTGSSSWGHEQREVRIEEAEDGDPLCRLQEGSQMTAGETSRGQGSGPVAQNYPSRDGSALSAWETLQSYTQRSSTSEYFFFLIPPPAACGEQTSITSFWREKRESEELCQNHPHLRDDGSPTYRSDCRHGEK